MKRVWTDSQRQAIDAKGGSVIVSAAAGSGKTAVLVQRVIKRITDKENPVDADRILVVTYTRAAAAELKERLNAKLTELIKEDPFNKQLLRQQSLMSKAHISTIDGFCSSLVKEYFYVLDIDRNFRIADESELALIKNDALKLTLDSMYASAEPDFFHLVEAFGGTKDDSALEKTILKIHTFLRSHPFPDLWIDKKLQMFSQFDTLNDSVWGKIILSYAQQACEFLTSLLESSFDLASYDDKLKDAVSPLLNSDKEFLFRLQTAVNNPQEHSISVALKSFDKGRMPTIKGYKDNYYKCLIESNRKLFKSTVSNLCDLFMYDIDNCHKEVADLYVVSHQLFNCVQQFSDNYQKLKAVKKIADYPDLEHWTIKLLIDKNTMTPTDVAYKLQSGFDEIMVDEYQDANEAQDLIFSALSKNNTNLFFVGDVKQSIYGFRQAMPQLFINRKEKSVFYDEKQPVFPAKIFLDKNFRSISGVTSAVNFFFSKLMSDSVGDIVYDDNESLKCGAQYETLSEPSTCYHMLSYTKDEKANPDIIEARYIASLILKMIKDGYKVKDGDTYRSVTYGDFAILMRSAKEHANVYVDTLISCSVPAYCENTYSFLNAHEIMVMTNLLSVIDNPMLDIELLSVMMSPIFGFTPDDLAQIRAENKKCPLYKSVMKEAACGNIKCQHLLDELAFYRDLSVTTPVSVLINTIYERTGYMSIVSATSQNDLAISNLRLLKEYAKDFESGVGKGLSRFVSYIKRLRDNDSDIAGAADLSASSHNAVRVMSIHSSKGLEFPVCILANTARKFVTDTKENVLLHSELGIAVKQKIEDINATVSTMPREAVSLALKRDEKSEELRVLYVAMTRAKQKLIMISSHDNIESYLKRVSSKLTISKSIMPFVIRNSSILSEWITMCAMLHPDGEELRQFVNCDIKPDYSADFEFDVQVVDADTESLAEETYAVNECIKPVDGDNLVVDTLNKRTSFVYKNDALRNIPSKVSASELAHKLSDKAFDRILNTPAFMSDSKLTAASKGTALHAFMQFCDFSSARNNIESEIERLCQQGFISQIQAQSIDREKALRFIHSDVISRCINSDNVMKEYRFTIKVNASLVDEKLQNTKCDEQIILQGAVDLAFVENGELVIVDYKTDNVKDPQDLYGMYHNQLEIYKDAMEQCTDYKVKECLIYSIKHSACITI